MAIDRQRFVKECEFARLVLKNTIANLNNNPEMIRKALLILQDPKLFEQFVINRIKKKDEARNELNNKVIATDKPQALGRFMSWLPFKK